MLRLPRRVLLLCALAAAAVAAETPRQVVLRLNEVLKSSSVSLAVIEATRKDEAEFQRQDAQLTEVLKVAKAQLDAATPGSDEALKARERTEQLTLRRRQLHESYRTRIAPRRAQAFRQIYGLVRQHVADFARDRRLGLVLLNMEQELSGTEMTDLALQASLNVVLYADPALDITGEFLPFFNQRTAHLVLLSATASATAAPVRSTP